MVKLSEPQECANAPTTSQPLDVTPDNEDASWRPLREPLTSITHHRNFKRDTPEKAVRPAGKITLTF
ncbi:hypothetical protein ABIB00_006303 [Bradyrhizobium sp. LB14.3]